MRRSQQHAARMPHPGLEAIRQQRRKPSGVRQFPRRTRDDTVPYPWTRRPQFPSTALPSRRSRQPWWLNGSATHPTRPTHSAASWRGPVPAPRDHGNANGIKEVSVPVPSAISEEL
jgi:hypothetical protein